MPTRVVVGLIPSAGPTGAAVWDDPVELGHGVTLARVPEYLANLAGPGLTWEQLGWLVPHVDHVLLCPYELDADPGPKFAAQQVRIGERLILANLAVWLANPHTDLCFRYVLHLRLQERAELRRLRPREPLHTGRVPEPTTLAHLAEARGLHEILGNLHREGPLWIAVRTLWGALTEIWFHSRYAQLWTALEALFGPRDSDTVSFRVSQNLAFFLDTTAKNRLPLFRASKKAYRERSKIVHGEGEAVEEAEYRPLTHRAEEWLRVAIVRILRDPDYRTAFETAERRDEFFERLVFVDGAEPASSAGGAVATT